MKVLISRGYGAGWSTWNLPELATDKDLIELVENGCTEEEMAEACANKGYVLPNGCPIYMGGFDGLSVENIPQGLYFKIREFDGLECIETFNPEEWSYAEE